MTSDKENVIKATQITLHSVRNMLGEQSQLTLFSNHDEEFASEYGIKLEGKIDRFGIDLTDMQSMLMEGILRGFSETKFRGNLELEDKEKIAEEKYDGKLPSSYKYIKEIPRIRANQRQILEWANINTNSIATWVRAIEALQELGKKQYCFYYDRLAFDENGVPEKDNHGNWKKEEVVAVDTLFTIKEVRHQDSAIIKYYEITPSSIFLDQRENYFMLIPYNWREEVKSLVGNKKASSYTFRFLLFLRYQYELKRRSKRQEVPYQIKWSPEEIAIAIKAPESVYKRKKKRLNEILEDAYSVAKRLGYLAEYERKEYCDILTLNPNKYFSPNDISLKKAIDMIGTDANVPDVAVKYIFDTFHNLRKTLDPYHQLPKGANEKAQLDILKDLLKIRPTADVEKLIKWSLKQPYWCSRLSTPKKLKDNFSDAWLEFTVSNEGSKEDVASYNKKLATKIVKTLPQKKLNQVKVEVLNQYVEIGNGVHQPICIYYTEKDFEEKLLHSLSKWGIVLS